MNLQLTNAKADAERMRWMLLSKAKVATDQVLGVQARLEHVSALLADRDKQLAELNAHLQQVRFRVKVVSFTQFLFQR